VSGEGSNFHIYTPAYTKRGKGEELHLSYFKGRKNTFKYVILVIKDEF